MNPTTALASPFTLNDLNRKLGWPVSPLLGTYQLQKVYDRAVLRADGNFFGNVLREMQIDWKVAAGALENIPKKGPLVIVSNHPFGGLDGLVLGAALAKIRPDFKLLVNYLLNVLPELGDWAIPVDPFGESPKASNLQSMRQSLGWLKQEKCLVVFPAGKVSHFDWKQKQVTDDHWNVHAAALAKKSGAKVVPIYFEGRNSLQFQGAGMVHPRLRTVMLPREMINKSGSTLQFSVGRPIGPEKIRKFDNHEELSQYLRLSTYALKGKGDHQVSLPDSNDTKTQQEKIIQPVPSDILKECIASLPASLELLRKGEYSIYSETGENLPAPLMREIGRLREVTFRDAGEGTGGFIDLDEYDPHYHQLFLWNHNTSEIVGAYRLCLMDQVVREHGVRGLYSATLFDLKPGFIDVLGKTVELGRSFIRPEYQRKYASLSLIWQGIGQFMARNPEYGNLYGCVSLTADYAPISRDLMVQFLRLKYCDEDLAALVKAKESPRIGNLARNLHAHLQDSNCTVEDVSALVSSIEEDDKGI
ncbi:MAG: lysophospholipid acyltransferase family protein, partial [Opitutae bacterium]|nr:lysophospholipid acyltransferase family protein [Opitutae bacterium]